MTFLAMYSPMPKWQTTQLSNISLKFHDTKGIMKIFTVSVVENYFPPQASTKSLSSCNQSKRLQ